MQQSANAKKMMEMTIPAGNDFTLSGTFGLFASSSLARETTFSTAPRATDEICEIVLAGGAADGGGEAAPSVSVARRRTSTMKFVWLKPSEKFAGACAGGGGGERRRQVSYGL